MDNLKDSVPPPCDEEWFDMFPPPGKEFELPNVSSLMSPPQTDASFIPFFSQDQLLDTPPIPDNAFFMSDLPSAEHHSFPLLEAVPSFAIIKPMVNQRVCVFGFTGNSSGESNMTSLGNHHIPVPTSVNSFGFEFNGSFPVRNELFHVPSSESISFDGMDINLSSINQNFHVASSTSSPRSFSIDSLPLESYPTTHPCTIASASGSNIHIPVSSQATHIPSPPNTFQFSYNGSSASNYASNHGFGFASLDGSNDSLSVGSQQTQISSFPDPVFFVSNGYPAMRNQPDDIPSLTVGNQPDDSSSLNITPCISAGGSSTGSCSNFSSQNTGHMEINESNVSNPVSNHVENLSETPQSNYSGSSSNQQAVNPGSLPVDQTSSRRSRVDRDVPMVCTECGLTFPNFYALGGHMSSHAKARKREAERTGRPYAWHTDSPVVQPNSGDGSDSMANVSTRTGGISIENMEVSDHSIGTKKRG